MSSSHGQSPHGDTASPNRNLDMAAGSNTTASPIQSGLDSTAGVVSTQTSVTPLSVSNQKSPNNPGNYKTKDGLIRMLLQTATPTIPPPQQASSNNLKTSRDMVQNNTQELKIHGAGVGQYNSGHITQPHPTAIHHVLRTPAQMSPANAVGHNLGQPVKANNIVSVSDSSQTNSSHTVLSHPMKIDLYGHGMSNKTSATANVAVSSVSGKSVSAVYPLAVAQSLTNTTSITPPDGSVAILDEAPSSFILQISETVIPNLSSNYCILEYQSD